MINEEDLYLRKKIYIKVEVVSPIVKLLKKAPQI